MVVRVTSTGHGVPALAAAVNTIRQLSNFEPSYSGILGHLGHLLSNIVEQNARRTIEIN